MVADWFDPSLPAQVKFSVVRSTVTQIKIDQSLVWNSDLFRNTFEVTDGVLVQPNGDLLFQLRRIGIFARLREIVFFSHMDLLSGIAWIHVKMLFEQK